MLPVVDAGDSYSLLVEFQDANGNPVVPASASYRITEATQLGGLLAEVLAPTNITPLAASVTLNIPPAQNAMLDAGRAFETRIVAVTAVYVVDVDVQVTVHQYHVRNPLFT
jgi:hypothetical protein